jgi:hypothetical protein
MLRHCSRGVRSLVLVSGMLAAASLISGCASSPRPQSRPSEPLADLVWLAGSWLHVAGDGTLIEEHWTGPAGGMMLGVGRTVEPVEEDPDAAYRLASWETFRIESRPDGSVVYLASPMGRQPPTPFTLEPAPATQRAWRLVFTNPQHDFPQVITYELQGGRDRLLVTIASLPPDPSGPTAEQPVAAESIAWLFRRMEHPSEQLWRRLDHQRHMMDHDAFRHGTYKTTR